MQIEIKDLGSSGEGVGRTSDGYTLFVDGALPGELVEIEIVQSKKTYGKGKLLNIIKPSPDRISPPCPVFDRCGGCQIQHMSYPSQLKMKRKRVKDALERIGHLKDVEVKECISSPNEFHYRNKMQLPVVDGKMGLFERRSNRLVKIDNCPIHCDLGEEIFSALKKHSLENTNIKHVLIKSAIHTEQVLVIFVCKGKPSPKLIEIGKALVTSVEKLNGVVANINTREDNVILGEKFLSIAGSSFITEKQMGLTFKISPASFFQVNPYQTENLYDYVTKGCALKGDETVLDVYCGVGTLGLHLANNAKKIIGIECVPEAIEDALFNAENNGIKNTQFICGDANQKIQEVKYFDIALLNPPRKGCDEKILNRLLEANPKKILYISCNPATLARDLQTLSTKYSIDKVQPFDMFPQTAHVETVAVLHA